jgi:hypothetical protein
MFLKRETFETLKDERDSYRLALVAVRGRLEVTCSAPYLDQAQKALDEIDSILDTALDE